MLLEVFLLTAVNHHPLSTGEDHFFGVTLNYLADRPINDVES